MKALERDHKREKDMVRRRRAGETLEMIAAVYDLSRERVRQILKRLEREGKTT